MHQPLGTSRPPTRRALYHGPEWDPSYEYGDQSEIDDPFDWLVSSYCLYPGGPHPLLAVDADCLASHWWPVPTPTKGSSFAGLLNTTDPLQRRDRAIFAALGEGDLELSTKQLFCLCEYAPQFQWMVAEYLTPVNLLAWMIGAVALVTSAWTFCLCCCVEDSDKYYDPELL